MALSVVLTSNEPHPLDSTSYALGGREEPLLWLWRALRDDLWMDQLQRQIDAQADRLVKEAHILDVTLDRHSPVDTSADAALLIAQAKRVRNATNKIIRLLAQARDDLH